MYTEGDSDTFKIRDCHNGGGCAPQAGHKFQVANDALRYIVAEDQVPAVGGSRAYFGFAAHDDAKPGKGHPLPEKGFPGLIRHKPAGVRVHILKAVFR